MLGHRLNGGVSKSGGYSGDSVVEFSFEGDQYAGSVIFVPKGLAGGLEVY